MGDKDSIIVGVIFGIIFGGAGIGGILYEVFFDKAIEHNAAYYHPQTGEFTWRECKADE